MAGETTERAGVCDRASHVDLLLGADDVAAIRFAPDPVWETVASLGVLAHPRQALPARRTSSSAWWRPPGTTTC